MAERIDFKQIIADIETAGVTPYKLALMMHRQFGWIQRIQAGQEPKYYEGEMLIQIHAEYVKPVQEMVSRETFENKPTNLQMSE